MRVPRSLFSFAVLAALVAFAVGARSFVAADASTATVEEAQVESKFPDGILFKVRLSNPQVVKTITVRFGVIGAKVPRYEYLPAPQAATGLSELLVRTDTGDRYIPPGVLMEYFFEVEDTSGNTARSEPERFIFDDIRFKWEELSGNAVTIRYYGPVKRRAETVLEAVNGTVERIGRGLFGLKEVSPVRLTLYNNWRDMVNALPPTSRVQRGELITEGTTFSNFGIILLLADDPTVRGLASHEMVHFLLDDAMGGLSQAVPVWMNEGLAEYGNVEPSQVYEQYLSLALVRSTIKPLTALTRMPGKSDEVIVVYGQGRSVMEYLIETYGALKLQQVLRAMREGQGVDRALEQAYGFDRFALDQRWRASIGAPPLSQDVSKAPLPDVERPVVAPLPFPQPTAPQSAQEAKEPAKESAAEEPSAAGGGACSRSSAPGAADLGIWLGLGAGLAFIAARRLRL